MWIATAMFILFSASMIAVALKTKGDVDRLREELDVIEQREADIAAQLAGKEAARPKPVQIALPKASRRRAASA